jgi:hypothetical protein
MINKLILKDVEGSGRDLISSIIAPFVLGE